ncbi:hypothetical protein HY345_02090 [Candidatus Microgenomates bacterium]|nr:hypothetical protein [Candidatus Microgenomates bacterium]
MSDRERMAGIKNLYRTIDRAKGVFVKDAPSLYLADDTQLTRLNSGENVTQNEAFSSYFARMESGDSQYWQELNRISEERQTRTPDLLGQLRNRRLQIIVPAYREGENMPRFLELMESQFRESSSQQWGITFVIDYAFPYRNTWEYGASQEMIRYINAFREQHPDLASRVDYVFFRRKLYTNTEVLSVGLARKVGEDVLMLEKMRAVSVSEEPFYLGLMDMDVGYLSRGMVEEVMGLLPTGFEQKAKVIRARGRFEKDEIEKNLHLHPMELVWEGAISAIAKMTKHNPFNLGRFSVVPARELAITGGGFAQKLAFTDEDVRHGIQIMWQCQNVEAVEVASRYSTSARREIDTASAVRQMAIDKEGRFDFETMECGALIKMYQSWFKTAYRHTLDNVNLNSRDNHENPLENPELFNQLVPPAYIEAMINAFYRFTLFGIFAIDRLHDSPFASEVGRLRTEFLKGNIAYFEVELGTHDFLRQLAIRDPESFSQLRPELEKIDALARLATEKMLQEYKINYVLQPGFTLGMQELGEGERNSTMDHIELVAPFKIDNDQSGYMRSIKEELED